MLGEGLGFLSVGFQGVEGLEFLHVRPRAAQSCLPMDFGPRSFNAERPTHPRTVGKVGTYLCALMQFLTVPLPN